MRSAVISVQHQLVSLVSFVLVVFLGAFSSVCSTTSLALADGPPALAEVSAPATRALGVAFHPIYVFRGPSAGGGAGMGTSATYEFRLKPRFSIGLPLAYRRVFTEPGMSQIGYGVKLRHGVWSGLYLAYGLLVNVSWVAGRPGSGTAHDTQLAAGWDFTLGRAPFFVEAAYHYSRLRHFETAPLVLDYLETSVGWRFEW